MKTNQTLVATLALLGTLSAAQLAVAAPVTFQVVVPRRTGLTPVTQVQLVLDVAPTGAPASDPVFQLSVRGPGDVAPAAITPATGLDALTFASSGSPTVLVEWANGDTGTVIRPSSGSPGDPARYRYTVNLRLSSDFNATTCASTWPAATTSETWTFTVDGVPIGARCLISYTTQTGGSCASVMPISSGDVAAYSSPFVPGEGVQTCAGDRPAVGVMMVLDRSCSMSDPAQPGGPFGGTRSAALAGAVRSFVETWTALGAKPGDQLGLAYFSDDAQWMDTVGVPSWTGGAAGSVSTSGTKIQPFSTISPLLTAVNLGAVSPDSATSIGDGLQGGVAGLSGLALTSRQVVLLMTDGLQNTTQCVSIVGGRVKLHDCSVTASAASPDLLPASSPARIYSVTVGEATGGATINQDIANATGGLYAGTTDGTELTPFFHAILENFLRFGSHQTLLLSRIDARGGPVEQKFWVTGASVRAALHLERISGAGAARLRSPSGQEVQVALPGATVLPNEAGEWTLVVSSPVAGESVAHGRGILLDAVVISDDLLVKADQRVAPKAYHVGDALELSVRLTGSGRAILGAGAGAGERVVAHVLAPGQSLGELLSTSSAPATPNAASDQSTPANEKLQNALEADPSKFALSPNDVVLHDDGQDGDQAASDGVYSGRFTTTLPGVHRVLFDLVATSTEGGRFTRRSLESVYVRPVPEGSLGATPGLVDGVAGVVFTPRIRGGTRLGPGWATYFVATTASGTKLRPIDRLDGSYGIQLPAGVGPGELTIGFIDAPLTITPAQPVENIPADVITTSLGCLDGQPAPCNRGEDCLHGISPWVIALILIVIIAVIILRSRRP